MRALVLEDDERLRSIVVRALTRIGLACDEASSIAEADELISLHGYDLLVLDRRLPDGDGLEVCRRARANAFRNSILVLTAMDDPDQEVQGLSKLSLVGRHRGERRLVSPALHRLGVQEDSLRLSSRGFVIAGMQQAIHITPDGNAVVFRGISISVLLGHRDGFRIPSRGEIDTGQECG